MKLFYSLFIPALLLSSSCKKGNNLPSVQTITKGNLWGIEIGSSPEDVYTRLQSLGKEKDFATVAVAYRQEYATPQQIEHILPYYNAVTLLSSAAVIYRVMIEFPQDKVSSISAGGALPDEITQWPQGVPDAVAIHADDAVSGIYTKLAAIYQLPDYSNYQLILPDKPLNKPFDPDMANYDQWDFTFSHVVKPGITGTSIVRIFFKDGKLTQIWHQYNEGEVFN